jgi:hypothetical protein
MMNLCTLPIRMQSFSQIANIMCDPHRATLSAVPRPALPMQLPLCEDNRPSSCRCLTGGRLITTQEAVGQITDAPSGGHDEGVSNTCRKRFTLSPGPGARSI